MVKKNYNNSKPTGRNLIPDSGVFNYLSDSEKKDLGRHSTYKTFTRHDVLFMQNMPSDHVVFVLDGLIKIYKGGRGDRIICISLAGTDQFAGLSSAFGSNKYMNSSSSIENSSVLMIRTEAVMDMIKSNGAFAAALIRILSEEVLDISDKLVNFSIKQLPGRVADLLKYFSEDIFLTKDFTVPLTRQELAELIGTTKESLIRTLIEFRNDKIIDLDGKHIRILAPEIIAMLSDLG